ncbi:hypothetical protein AUEXF2481DRAFT_677968 [Aureobasidium subglaciale EXF-2481]|uniref:Uncharacterized protein n=1 Tax=Aureobasidium subglaciale (strain EXF-2481) TaxID=1043005 RepID=A0A074YNI1_AURSE|nr:uncharacterized protein AUEXF2481DRAFT_677968 [Aureobasidium subglaciale EXF-2481]KEQ95612.1 hypothetical protein AUEXF2481DRAFT_677968 [Aureobasidium subglaciale EXF-2481]
MMIWVTRKVETPTARLTDSFIFSFSSAPRQQTCINIPFLYPCCVIASLTLTERPTSCEISLQGLVLHLHPEFKQPPQAPLPAESSTSISDLLTLRSTSASSCIILAWSSARNTTRTTLYLYPAGMIATLSLTSSSACTSACVSASRCLTRSSAPRSLTRMLTYTPTSSFTGCSITASQAVTTLKISQTSFSLLNLFLLNNLLTPNLDLPIEDFDPDVPECDYSADCEEHGEEDCDVCFHCCG